MNQRRKFKELFTEEMKQNDNIILLVGDVGYKIFDHLREEFPSRVINAGASEQLMIGMAAGLAMDGKIPVCYSITPFVLYRPFEFIRNYLNEVSEIAHKIDVCIFSGPWKNLPEMPQNGAGMCFFLLIWSLHTFWAR